MRRLRKGLKRYRMLQGGGVAIEFAIVAFAFVIASLGVVEFGRALYVRNELAFAVDHGARTVLMDSAASETALRDAIKANFKGFDPDAIVVNVTTETVNGINFRAVTASYPLRWMIPGLADSITLTVERRTPETNS